MRLENINPTANSDWLCTIEGLGDYHFSKFSGVKEKFNRPVFADGLSAKKRRAQTGSSEVEDCTLSKVFDPEKDTALLQWIEDRRDGSAFNCLVRPVKRNKEIEFRGNKAYRLSTCRLISYSAPGEVDTSDGETVSMIEIGFSVEEAIWAGV